MTAAAPAPLALIDAPVLVVGRGRLAQELLAGLPARLSRPVQAWGASAAERPAIVAHAGSGDALPAVAAFCHATGSVLLELATGTPPPPAAPGFAWVLCPNTNVLMLKVMHLLAQGGALFAGCHITIEESHQASKTSVPGTAVALAHALGVPAQAIRSERDPARQRADWHIAEADLARHAAHRITLSDGDCQVRLETRVTGSAPYVDGVARIIEAAARHPLEPRVHDIDDFVRLGWL